MKTQTLLLLSFKIDLMCISFFQYWLNRYQLATIIGNLLYWIVLIFLRCRLYSQQFRLTAAHLICIFSIISKQFIAKLQLIMLCNKNCTLVYYLSKINSNMNPYKVLDIPQGSSIQQIKTKYYQLAQQYHPDINQKFHSKFQQINEAYSLLKDVEKKKQVDRNLSEGKAAQWAKSYYARTHHYGHTVYDKQQDIHKSKKKYDDSSKYSQWNNKTEPNVMRSSATSAIKFYNKFRYFIMLFCGLGFSFLMVQVMIGVYEFNRGIKKYTPLEQ